MEWALASDCQVSYPEFVVTEMEISLRAPSPAVIPTTCSLLNVTKPLLSYIFSSFTGD